MQNLKRNHCNFVPSQYLKISLYLILLATSLLSLCNALYVEEPKLISPGDLQDTQNNDTARILINHNQQSTTDKATSVNSSASSLEAHDNVPIALPVEASPSQLSAVTSSPISSTTTTTTENINDYVLDKGVCSLSVVLRKSRDSLGQENEVSERALACSRVDDKNHLHMIKSTYKKNKLSIQQLEITNSEPPVLLPAIDFICSLRFNCSKLKVFNASGQKIQETNGLNSWISSWSHLEVLDLSNTSLKSIESILQLEIDSSEVILQNLTTLLLDSNSISELNFTYILKHFPNLRHLSLVNNKIFNINCDETLRSRLLNQLETVYLANNSINCEKSQLWLMKQILNLNLKFPDHHQINCSSPERLTDMTWLQRVSVLETRICDDCDCKSLKKSAIAVDCHNKNLIALPDILPLNTKILNLTSNRINSLGVPPNSKNWENVTYVYLENNLINSFKPLEINSKFMRNLAALDIRRNRFQEFPSHIFEQFINLDQVHLSNNPWLCDCEPTFAFQEWLQRQFHKVGDKEEIMCGISGSDENGVKSYSLNQRLSSRVIYRLDKSELCPQENLDDPQEWLNIVNLLLSLSIILILAKVTLDYIYQHRTKRLPHFFKLNL